MSVVIVLETFKDKYNKLDTGAAGKVQTDITSLLNHIYIRVNIE